MKMKLEEIDLAILICCFVTIYLIGGLVNTSFAFGVTTVTTTNISGLGLEDLGSLKNLTASNEQVLAASQNSNSSNIDTNNPANATKASQELIDLQKTSSGANNGQSPNPMIVKAAMAQQQEAKQQALPKDAVISGPVMTYNYNHYIKDGLYHILGQVNNTNATIQNIGLKITLKDINNKIIGLKNTTLPTTATTKEDTFDITIKDSDVATNVFDIKSYTTQLYTK